MKYQEILELLKAGYTREEIEAMNQPEDQPEDHQEDKTEDQTPALQQVTDQLAGYLKQINDRIMDLQAANIYNAQQPDTTADHPKTAEEALEELIRPRTRAWKKED